ncbi:MAG: hypothetical protein NZM15_08200 [Flavobacteriales bacterium]|nr:hypothetical protein [Flavobacteriales bacterium]MDW8432666.1 hypothetical protein [Flavobacteriales bacterium]
MKSLLFSEYELQELRNFYEHQMQKMRERMEHIQSILDKVAGEAFAVAEAVLNAGETTSKTAGASQNAEDIIARAGLRATKWNKFIINTLLTLRRPLTIQELTELAAKEFKFSPKDLEKVRLTINQALIRIRKTNAVKEHKVKGLKTKYFGLEAWFDGSRLLDDFQKLIENAIPQTSVPARRGRSQQASVPKKSVRRGRKKKTAEADEAAPASTSETKNAGRKSRSGTKKKGASGRKNVRRKDTSAQTAPAEASAPPVSEAGF